MKILVATFAFALALASAPPAAAGDFVSKSYEFKPNTVLQVGYDLEGNIRFDSIEFKLSGDASKDDGPRPLFDRPRVVVTISNHGKAAAKVGIAVAVVGSDGSLVAAGSGGTKMFPLRAGRQIAYTIAFDDVVDHIREATAFRITIETK